MRALLESNHLPVRVPPSGRCPAARCVVRRAALTVRYMIWRVSDRQGGNRTRRTHARSSGVRRLRAVSPARSHRHRQKPRQRRRKGHSRGRVVRRGLDVAGRRSGTGRAAGAAPARPPWSSCTSRRPPRAYLDKTNATVLHAALRLDPRALAVDMVGSVRSGVGAFLAGTQSAAPTLVVLSDVRTGLPGGADERDGGDGAAAFVVGPESAGPSRARRTRRERIGDRGVPRPLADPGRRRVPNVGGAFRRGGLPAARRRRLSRKRSSRPISRRTRSTT